MECRSEHHKYTGMFGVCCGDVILEFFYSDIVFMCFSRFMIYMYM